MFYNNGAGVAPNTLTSEPFQPATDGIIANNKIFWNNFDYYLPGSPVKTVSSGLATVNGVTANYPIGAGVLLFGTAGWVVKNNQIFGNWLWGAGAFSNPLTERQRDQQRQPDHQQPDGLRRQGPERHRLVQRRLRQGHMLPRTTARIRRSWRARRPPTTSSTRACPSTAGTGSVTGDATQQSLLISIATANPAATMNTFFTTHPHIKIKGITPFGG